ncbi:membrane-associated tyrosine- and threonine-specific cdc2-inhibitory kinase [Nematocida major]|uniref:membrane-associated tyrosine- and threonine-specific cdc2-inhibitory kinase n=1 Tax=Nematocida major TaxID=1912982 RepID=UPI0020086664|nr:membrane-associated tyrosine- and threonine-specific cdc2-inhibitory kinase [Nematocida major]KAH9385756.1 membrane-associated tyrosine- and threonine-specific cdc2-inhibitory kinase [Nematocida major]
MGEAEEKKIPSEVHTDSEGDNEYENARIIPKTPEKKHPVKHISNIETPFKLKISREGKIAELKTNPPNNPKNSGEESEIWFRKKRFGRRKRVFIAETETAAPVVKAQSVCPVKRYFSSHFSIKAPLHISPASEVYLVQKFPDAFSSEKCAFCTSQSLGVSVVKVSRRKWATKQERAQSMKEAKFLYRLRKSRFVVEIFRAWEEAGLLHIEMFFCNLGTLKEAMKREHSPSEKAEIAAQILKGVKAVHANRIIHLDIKPENIYLNEKNGVISVRIGDFGISRSVFDLTEIEFDGDRLYMAPELLQNACSYASDIYSTGLVLMEFLFDVGAPLKSVRWESVCADVKKELIRKSGVSEGMYRVVKSMISEDPGKRPSAEEAVKEMQAAQDLANKR